LLPLPRAASKQRDRIEAARAPDARPQLRGSNRHDSMRLGSIIGSSERVLRGICKKVSSSPLNMSNRRS
jgi:hypothetical protein